MPERLSKAAVLFADVSDSSKLYESSGDTVAHAAVARCVNLMREKTVQADGRVIKTIGDECMSWFPSADAAAGAAIEMQLAVSELPPVGSTRMGVRIGFHFGPLVERDGDVFGDAVNLASRLAGVATKGQIIIARETVMQLSPMLKGLTRAITTIQVKGKTRGTKVYELLWQQSEDLTALGAHQSTFKPRKAVLRLLVHGAELVLGEEKTALVLGRDMASDVVIAERLASRAHGKIERRLDKFVLTDHSVNGTFITIDGDREIVLRREEFTLRGHGWIAFGQSRSGAADVIEFFCD